ncbi:MAG TPA: hypothetical protein VF479_03140 [Pseudolysinimonas sp.]
MDAESESEPESGRVARFRDIATRALGPYSILAPVALVLSAGLIPPSREEHGWATVLGVTAIIAVVLLFVLLVMVRLLRAKWLRSGTRGLTLRESGVFALHVFLLLWWCFGLRLLANGPSSGDGIGSLAFINGMFGTAVTLGVLIHSATRPVTPSS